MKLKDLLNFTLVKKSSNSINALDDLNNHHIYQERLQNVDQFYQLNGLCKQGIGFQNVGFVGSLMFSMAEQIIVIFCVL